MHKGGQEVRNTQGLFRSKIRFNLRYTSFNNLSFLPTCSATSCALDTRRGTGHFNRIHICSSSYPSSPKSQSLRTQLSSNPFRPTMTTIESLPIETLTQIIEEVAALDDRRSLLYCSRVSRRWTDISLARLYEHLEIMTIKVAEAFAHSAALTRYRTRLLYIGCPCDWSVDLWKILNGCPELKELHLGPYLQEVPTNLFLHPSLASSLSRCLFLLFAEVSLAQN